MLLAIFIVVALGIGVIYFFTHGAGRDNNAEGQVRSTVLAFGKQMQNVPLQASAGTLIQAIENNYSYYVSPDVLTTWVNNPTKAPGRAGSGPWPDHIDIVSISQLDPATYAVQGNIVFNGAASAAQYAMSATVTQAEGRWVITDWKDDMPR